MTTIAEERRLPAPPDDVWAVVSDPVAMAALSPECVKVTWKGDGGPRPGARFRGWNRNGPFRWTTSGTVTDAVPGERFAYEVSFLGLAVAEWAFELAADGDGTRVRQSTTDRRGGLMRAVGPVGTGVRDRETHNRAGMQATLAGLEGLVEVRRAGG